MTAPPVTMPPPRRLRRIGPDPYPPGSPEWETLQTTLANLAGETLVRRFDAKPNPRGRDWCENPTPGWCAAGERWLARCKLYRCSYCGSISADEWRETVLHAVEAWKRAGLHVYFITQTVTDHGPGSPWSFDSAEAHREVTRKWAAMRKRLERQTGGPIFYALAIERHRSGVIHWHILAASTQPLRDCSPRARGGKNRWRKARGLPSYKAGDHWCEDSPCISAVAADLGLGFADVRPVSSAGAGAAYITKYLAKGVGQHFPRYARRIRCSRLALPDGTKTPTVTETRRARRDAYLAAKPPTHHHDGCEPRRAILDYFGFMEEGSLVYLVAGERWPAHRVTELVPPLIAGKPPPNGTRPPPPEPETIPF